MKCLLIAISLFCLLFAACDDDNDNSPGDKKEIVFNGITETDPNGNTLSEDSTDWQLGDQWDASEKALFPGSNDAICDLDSFDYDVIAYPNPTFDSISTFRISVSKPEESLFSARIVDDANNTLSSLDSLLSQRNTLSFDASGLGVSGDTVRMYYKVIGQNCELKGHGDIYVK